MRTDTANEDITRAGDPESWKAFLGEASEDLASKVSLPSEELSLPSTLKEAMDAGGCRFNALFRLSVKLRSSKGGCDVPWVPNARNARRSSKKLNWHQHLGMNWCPS